MPNRDMTKLETLIGILRMQGIEVGRISAELKVGNDTYPAGSFLVKTDQPYGRLARTLLRKQVYPDATLTTYDDSGWTQGLATLVDVKEVTDKAILDANAPLVPEFKAKGSVAGSGSAGLAVAHYGSNNMITFRYRLKDIPMKIAEKAFTVDGPRFPAGSFVIHRRRQHRGRSRGGGQFGLTAAALSAMPDVASHDADAPRIAIYSQWSQTQDLGWYRLTFDNFGIPFDLIYKERVKKGNLKADYDVIIMAAQTINRQDRARAGGGARHAVPKSDKSSSSGCTARRRT